MKAMIFAAGLGTRLKPLTDDRPKAMVEIAGKPMLQHVIERVAAAGFDDITINIHHFGQMIIDFLEKNDNFGLNIHISDERGLLLDTGGGILKARQWLDGDDPFLVHNTDIISTLTCEHSMIITAVTMLLRPFWSRRERLSAISSSMRMTACVAGPIRLRVK